MLPPSRVVGPTHPPKRNSKSHIDKGCPILSAPFVFRLMTSFTKRLGTSVADHGCRRTKSPVRSGGDATGEVVHRLVPGVRHLSSYGVSLAEALSGSGPGGDRRAQPTSTAESRANLCGLGAARRRCTPALSRLGRAQTAGPAGAGKSGVDTQHHPPRVVASRPGARSGPAFSGHHPV
jgi:hypothetical protein